MLIPPAGKPVGRKIGFTNRAIWPKYGVYQPIWGTVYDSTLIVSENGKASVPLAGLLHPRIEPEICFKLRYTPPLAPGETWRTQFSGLPVAGLQISFA